MKYKSVETTKLNEQSQRAKMLEMMGDVSVVAKKRIKKLVSVLAVAAALFGPNGGIDSQRAQTVLAKDKIEEIKEELIQTGKDVVGWVRERGIPAAKEGIETSGRYVGKAVATATPVVEKTVQQVSTEVEQQVKENILPSFHLAVGSLYDFVLTNDQQTTKEVIKDTQTSNKTVELKLSDIENDILLTEITTKKTEEKVDNNKFFATVTPLKFGSEPENSLKTINKEEKLSISRPFDYKETNDVMETLGLQVVDLLNPDYEKIKYFDALTNPNVETLGIFEEQVMEWAPIIKEECAAFNSRPENKGFEVSPNVAMAVLTIETFGGQYKVNSYSGASGGYQFMPRQFYNDYILTGAFDGDIGRIISLDEFAGNSVYRSGDTLHGKPGLLHDKRYSTKLFIRYWSDMKRYNQDIYKQMNLTTPMQELMFQLAEYNGGQGNAINLLNGVSNNYENTRYVRMGMRIAIAAEIANDLRDAGYKEDYSRMLSSKLINQRIDEAFSEKDQANAGTFKATGGILKSVGQENFTAGIVTQKLFLEDIPSVATVSPTPDTKTKIYKYFENFAIKIIRKFEYNQ